MAFSFYSPVTVNNGQVPSAQTDYPVRIYQTDNRFKTVANGGHVQNSNGYDIRPYSDAALTTALTYELAFYDGTNGIVEMYVKRSSLADGTVTYVAYGDSTLNTDGSSTATWSNSFLRVCHFPNGVTLSLFESTGSDTISNINTVTAAAGKIDGAASFVSASSQYLAGQNAISPTAISLSAWIKATTFPGAYNTVVGHNTTNTAYSLLMVNSSGKLSLFTNRANYDGTGSHTLSTGTFYHVAMTYDNVSGLIGYVNGASDGTAAAGGTLNANRIINIGRDEVNGRYWNGLIDDVRVSSVARSANWITVEYNESTPSTFETLGTESPVGAIIIERRTLGPRVGSRQIYVD